LFNGTTAVDSIDLGSVAGTLGLLNQTDTPSGYLTTISATNLKYAFTSVEFIGNAQAFEIGAVSAVPIPGALPLFGSALIGIGALARRRTKKSA
jgi:hypothetical protein